MNEDSGPHTLDEILSDAHRILGDSAPSAVEAPAREEETIRFDPLHAKPRTRRPPWGSPDFAGTYDGHTKVIRSAAAKHARPSKARERRNEAAPMQTGWEERWEEAPIPGPEPPGPQELVRERRKKRHPIRNLLLVVLVLLVSSIGALLLSARQPQGPDGSGARKEGVSTLLLAGVDQDGTRTDTMLLLTVDRSKKTMKLLSLPRDTLILGPYAVPKLNGVYGVNGGGAEGTKMLLQRVGECIGFEPDGYALIDLESLIELVDQMGGVTFDVPQDMYYDDPSQDLHIALPAGEQALSGEQAMGLLRFRSGYAEADLRRVEVQRDFLSAAAKQWLPKLLWKAPSLLRWTEAHIETDLGTRELIWLALGLFEVQGEIQTVGTLPGHAATIGGVSYYVLEPDAVAKMVNETCNPYERDISVGDLSINY